MAGTVKANSYTHTGLQSGTTYYYYVTATNSAGESGQSSAVSAATKVAVPATPTGVSASLTKSSSPFEIRVSWNAVAGATSYEVRRRVEPGSWQSDTFTISGQTYMYWSNLLLTNTSYKFQVRAKNSAGVSAWSAESKGVVTPK